VTKSGRIEHLLQNLADDHVIEPVHGDANAPPEERATIETIRAFVEDYSQGHAVSSVAAVVHIITDMVRVTAPEADVQALPNLIDRAADAIGREQREARLDEPRESAPDRTRIGQNGLPDRRAYTLIIEGLLFGDTLSLLGERRQKWLDSR